MDKFREDFKKDFEFLDWFHKLSPKEMNEYLSKSDVIEGQNDPSILNFTDENEFQSFVSKYNLHNVDEILEKFNNL